MNTKANHTNDNFKRPLSNETLAEFKNYFEMASQYIKGLTIIENGKRKCILKSKSFTPYFGLYYNMISFIGIYNDYVVPNAQKQFYTFSVSQDHIETFFGCIRSMGGSVPF